MTGQILDVFHPAQYVDARNCMLVALERAHSRKKDQLLFAHVGDKKMALFDCDAYVSAEQWTHLVTVTPAGEVFVTPAGEVFAP